MTGCALVIEEWALEQVERSLSLLLDAAVFFLTCAGAKTFTDPRMNSLEAAFIFAKTSNLQVLLHSSAAVGMRA